MDIKPFEVEELAAKILGFGEDYDEEEVEQKLFDVYEISMDSFHRLISDLVPLCEVGESPITKQRFRGFADIENQCWIVRVDV